MYPEDYRYTKEHEWIKIDAKQGTVGITQYAVEKLGDVVFVELPEVGSAFEAMQAFGTVESVKAVSDLFCPVAGSVVEVNPELADNPALLNEDPYKKGWLIKLKLANPDEAEQLLSAKDYEQFVRTAEESES